jgi:hypothetical protein
LHHNLAHHVDNVSTPAVAAAHSARHASPTDFPPRPPATLTPRQQQLETSTQRPTTRETHTLQPTISPCPSTSSQQTTSLFRPSERKRKGTAKDKAIPPHDATPRNLFPLVPHKSHYPRMDHYGIYLPLLLPSHLPTLLTSLVNSPSSSP